MTQIVETAAQALAQFDASQNLQAFELLPPSASVADQVIAWRATFGILRHAQLNDVHAEKLSFLQYESWCYTKRLSLPADASNKAEVTRCNTIRAAAYSILREGFKPFVDRHLTEKKITIRKG